MITFFTTFKDISRAESNAVNSWLALSEDAEVIIFTETIGTSDLFSSNRVWYNRNFQRHESGLPLLNSIFEEASRVSKFDLLCYCNSDIILLSEFIRLAKFVKRLSKSFLVVSQRIDLNVSSNIDFNDSNAINEINDLVIASGKLHPPYGSDIFLFKKNQYNQRNMPPLVVGRPGWDNWMIYDARRRFNMLIEIKSDSVPVIHQNHELKYNHHQKEFLNNYEYLPIGFHYTFILSYSNYFLDKNGLHKVFYENYDVKRIKWEIAFNGKLTYSYWNCLIRLYKIKVQNKFKALRLTYRS